MSHSVWVRGLKLVSSCKILCLDMSHSVWVRGLKHQQVQKQKEQPCVALRVGAWIETLALPKEAKASVVALRVGAWIET